MTSLTATSLLTYCLSFALIINLLIYCCSAREIRRKSSLDSLNPKSSIDYDESLEPVVVEVEEAKETEDDRDKRALEIDEDSKKIIMLLVNKDRNVNETYDHIMNKTNSNFTIRDFMIRLQEKYEYSTCRSYLNAAKGVNDNYFRIPDDDLVNLPNANDTQFKGDEFSRADREERANDDARAQRRFRFFGEYCDQDNEWNFWRDMFIAAENDTIAIPKAIGIPGGGVIGPIAPPIQNPNTSTTTTPAPLTNAGSTGEFDYVQVPAGEMMKKFNEIWETYRYKSICNPKYLLECDQHAHPGSAKCKCQTNGIGLPTVVKQYDEDFKDEGDTTDFFTTQYYEDLKENDKGEVKIYHGQYLHKKKCVVTANLPESNLDIFITNPCDFFLPMIGLCRADCVMNASCRSVTEEEKDAMRTRSRRHEDFLSRIVNSSLHEVYHQKCICDAGKICRKITHETYGGATKVKSTLSSVNYHIFFIFQLIIMTGIDPFSKY